jgi:predicted acyltransferase
MSEENTTLEEPNLKIKNPKKERVRFGWLDQFRGLVIILFIIQTVAWKFSADPANILTPLMSPYLNHGFRYADFARPLITFIDLGQQIFIFLVGFMQAFAVLKRRQKGYSTKKIWIHIGKRFGIVMVLSILLTFAQPHGYNTWEAFFLGTLANIAWAGLAAGIVALYLPKGDKRLVVGLVLMVIHTICYAFPGIREWEGAGLEFPFTVINHMAISCIAAAFTAWIFTDDGKVKEQSMRARILPVSLWFFISSYFLDFLQWADHHYVTSSLVGLAIATSGFILYLFYKFDQEDFKIPGLTAMGKNMLMIFILSMILNELVYIEIMINSGLLGQNGLIDLLLMGIPPILFMWIIAKLLERFNLYIKI